VNYNLKTLDVPEERLELSRDNSQRLLRPQRLPISPSGPIKQAANIIFLAVKIIKMYLVNKNYCTCFRETIKRKKAPCGAFQTLKTGDKLWYFLFAL
jgi:hypothetical protein